MARQANNIACFASTFFSNLFISVHFMSEFNSSSRVPYRSRDEMCGMRCDVVNEMLLSGKLKRGNKNMLDILQVDEVNFASQIFRLTSKL